MKQLIFIFGCMYVFTVFAEIRPAKDLGFRYIEGKCINANGDVGLNPSIFGPCSDLRGVTLSRFDFSDIDFSGSQMSNADFQRSSFAGAKLVGVNFDNSNLSGVNFDSARILKSSFQKAILRNVTMVDSEVQESNFANADFITSNFSYAIFKNSSFVQANFSGVPLDQSAFLNCDLSEANFSSTTLSSGNFSESRMIKANLSGSNLIKVNFTGALLDSVNLTNSLMRYANFSNVSMKNSRLLGLNFAQANLDHADLSGSDLRGSDLSEANVETTKLANVIYNKRTVLPFSDEKAKEKGMLFKKANSILILPDVKNASLNLFAKALVDLGEEVTISAGLEYQFDGINEPLATFDVVIHMKAATFGQDLPLTGQRALVEFVRQGGTFIYGEWNSYEVAQGRLAAMKDLSLFVGDATEGETLMSLTATPDGTKGGLIEGLSTQFVVPISGHTLGGVSRFDTQPVVILMKDADQTAVVASRNLGSGHVVGFRFNCTENQNRGNCLRNKDVQRLYFNAGYLSY